MFTAGAGSYVNYGENHVKYYLVLYYGVAAKVHLLPIIINPSYRKFDVYANLHLGAKSMLYNYSEGMNNIHNIHTTNFINAGLGVGYNFNKRIGLFYECNYTGSDVLNGAKDFYGLNHTLGARLRF